MNSSKRSFNRKQVELQFDRAAATYDGVADLQRRMGDRLMERILESHLDKNAPLIDLGCGTGELLHGLSNAGFTKLNGLDLSSNMLEFAKEKVTSATLIHGDIENVPCRKESFQVVVSNAALQWCSLDDALAEVKRILTPGGTAYANVFVAGTLKQWQNAFNTVNIESRVHQLVSAEDVSASIARTAFNNHKITVRKETARFHCVDSMLSSIRKLGATNATATRATPIGKAAYRSLKEHFQQTLGESGSLELDFVWAEVVIES